ncbi:efflux RND transporter permease subunit [Sphingobacteriaceae bacterium WQ 2009]|uniref:Efflux RND transporter permease subunit n=1 Tax=Rhinopithecimicrobium faecis TaxID=2820698 RepID=A0A8T4HH56_9SPHI|nr:efflux RND transporter permease subunit [Sphingobacteriaceae bacterium WQ 2009]
MLQRFFENNLRRRWLIFSLFALLCLLGVLSWKRLAMEAYPDIGDVSSQVVTQVPGLAAEEIEQQITIPLERAINGLPGMHVMRSKSTFGLSIIVIVFQDGVEDYFARTRIAERIQEITLPYDAKPELDPLTSPTGEIFRYIVHSENVSLRELSDLQEFTIIPYLKQITGVADVTNFGGITTQFQLEVDPAKLSSYAISLSEVIEAMETNNANAGGALINRGDQSFVVRGIALVKDLADMGAIVIKSDRGKVVRLADIGTLQYGDLERKGALGYSDREGHTIADGVEGIVLLLKGENPSPVLAKVNAAVAELNTELLPESVQIKVVLDRTDLINSTLNTVSNTLLEGVALVVLVLILFLGSWRASLLVATTIPISMLIAFILMRLTDIPANLLSLGAIDFGIIVDGAIVIMESILKRREDNEEGTLEVPAIGTVVTQLGKPIFFATILIITAYLPLFAFERIERKLFTPMAFTVGYALLGALLCALIFIPPMAYWIFRKPQKIRKNHWFLKLNKRYGLQISRVLLYPKRIFAPLLIILVCTVGLTYRVGKDFLPSLDEGSIWLQVSLPPGITLEQSKKMSAELREATLAFEEVTYMLIQAGRNDDGTDAWTASHFECSVGLKPYKQWKNGRVKADLIADLQQHYDKMPGFKVGFSQPMIDGVMDKIAGAHAELVLKVFGDDFIEMRRVAEAISSSLHTIHGAADIHIDQEPPLAQIQVHVDREKVAYYGLNAGDIMELIEVGIGGKELAQVYVGAKQYAMTARYSPEVRNSPELLAGLMLTNGDGIKIPLGQVADIRLSTGESTIAREMNKRHLTVSLNLRGRDLSSFLAEAKQKIATHISYDPKEVSLVWGGQFENQDRAYAHLALIIPMVLALMFVLLFTAFGQFNQALLLMSIVPLALFGGMLALNVRGMTLNVSSAVGFIALFGVAIQNGVLMISHMNQLRKDGYALIAAVVQGATDRFRPVLMTSIVAVLGLFPASLATGIGSDVQRPLATVIVYGLLFSTVITLYAIPTLYYLMEKSKAEKND